MSTDTIQNFAGRVAIVTGGGGGIGTATAKLLAGRGASVVVADINLDTANQTADAITAAGGKALPVHLDLADEASIEAMYQTTLEAFGDVDIVVNNAAALSQDMAQRDGNIEDMPNDIWDLSYAVNVRGTMISCRNALKIMRPKKAGVIVNVASNLALQGNVIQAAYSSSKAAVIQMTRSIATSHGKVGIRCNAVLPGLTGSPAAFSHLPQSLLDIVREETLTPYLGEPPDIAYTIAFLAADEARYITGQAIAADGGTAVHIPGFARLREFFGAP